MANTSYTWTSPAPGGSLDISTNATITEAYLDGLASNLLYKGGTVGYISAEATRSSNQSIGNNALTAVTFPNETVDTDGMFTAGGTLVTVQHAGLYLAMGWCVWTANAAQKRVLQLLCSGASTLSPSDRRLGSTDNTEQFVSWATVAAIGDTFGLSVFQDSGGALILNGARLWVMKI